MTDTSTLRYHVSFVWLKSIRFTEVKFYEWKKNISLSLTFSLHFLNVVNVWKYVQCNKRPIYTMLKSISKSENASRRWAWVMMIKLLVLWVMMIQVRALHKKKWYTWIQEMVHIIYIWTEIIRLCSQCTTSYRRKWTYWPVPSR